MARKKYEDGTVRIWVRVTEEVEAELKHLAVDLKERSHEPIGGRLLTTALKEYKKQKPKK